MREADEVTWVEPTATVGELARATVGGERAFRAQVMPLLSRLWTFVAARTPDPQDVPEAVAETLLAARARAPRAYAAAPLLPWLLGLAVAMLRSRVGMDEARVSGFAPAGDLVPPALRSGWEEGLRRLGRRERLLLGMRFGDRLPLDTAASVLGVREGDARSLQVAALRTLTRAAPLDGTTLPRDPVELDRAISALLAPGRPAYADPGESAPHSLPEMNGEDGADRSRAPVSRPSPLIPAAAGGASSLVERLAALPPRPAPELDADAVWREFEEGRAAYLPGSGAGASPPWLRGALAAFAAVAVALAGLAVWRATDAPPAPRPLVAARSTAAPPGGAVDTPLPDAPLAGVLRELRGRLYYVRGGERSRLTYTAFGGAGAASLTPRRVVEAARAGFTYAVSPADGRVAYSAGRGLWVADPGRGFTQLLLLRRGSGEREDGVREPPGFLRIGPIAWHPEGHTLAFTDMYQYDIQHCVSLYTPDLEAAPRAPAACYPRDEPPTGIEWSPSGAELLVRTAKGTNLVGAAAGPYYRGSLPYGRAAWVGTPSRSNVLGVREGTDDATPRFEVLDLRTRLATPLALPDEPHWAVQPDGRSVVTLSYGSRPEYGATASLVDLTTGEERWLSKLPGITPAVREVAFAGDGAHLAYPTTGGIRVANYRTGVEAMLPGVSGPVAQLRWSGAAGRRSPPPPRVPIGGSALWVERTPGADGEMRRSLIAVNLRTGERRRLARAASLEYAVSPWGTHAVVAVGGGADLHDLRDGTVTGLLPGIGEGRDEARGPRGRPAPEPGVLSPTWHPSGEAFAYIEEVGWTTRLVRVSVDAPHSRVDGLEARPPVRREVFMEVPRERAPSRIRYSPSGRWLLLWDRHGWSVMPAEGGRELLLPPAVNYEWAPGADRLLRSAPDPAVLDARGRRLYDLPAATSFARWADRDTTLIDLGDGPWVLRTEGKQGGLPVSSPERIGYDGAPISPGGGWALFAGESSLWAQELATGRRVWLGATEGRPEGLTWASGEASADSDGAASAPRAGEPTSGLFFRESSRRTRSPFQALRLWSVGRPSKIADVSAWSVSPAGDAVAYIDRWGLWIWSFSTGTRRLLPFEDGAADPATRLASPVWSPDGERIAFAVVPRTTAPLTPKRLSLGVWVVDEVHLDSRHHAPRLVVGTDPAHYPRGLAWRADGETLLVSLLGRTEERDLRGRLVRTLPFGQAALPEPSPHRGDRAVLVRGAGRGAQGMVRLHDGARFHPLSRSARAAFWAPDGGSVYLVEGRELVRASRDGTHRWRVAMPERLPEDAHGFALGSGTGTGPLLMYVTGRGVHLVDLRTGRSFGFFGWREPILEIEEARTG